MDAFKFNEACSLVSTGMSLRKACAQVGLTLPTFLRWVGENPELADQYARAKEAGCEIEFEKLNETASEQPPQIGPNGAVDAGWVAWKRLQVDTAKWSLSKKVPKKYGDKVEHDHGGKVGLVVEVVKFASPTPE